MSKLNESAIEAFAITLLEQQGYTAIHGLDIAPDGDTPERSDYAQVLLTERLDKAIRRINPRLSEDVLLQARKDVERVQSQDLLANNEAFHRLLTEGVPVSIQQDGNERGERVWLIDFDRPENNEFAVISQFTVIENHQNKRPDLVLFVNGVPLVVIELKNAGDENASVKSAFKQIETYKALIPSLFNSNAFIVISDGLEAKAGSISSGLSRFMHWKTADGKAEASKLVSQLETLIVGMLHPKTLLDLIRHFIVFEKSSKEDPVSGLITINTVKKLAAYHQYYAVNAAVASTLRAADMDGHSMIHESPASYGLPGVSHQPKGDRKAGVVWHTQGSGKSLSMVFYTGKIVLALNNPTVLVITDRNDLDDQLFDTFASSKQLLRQEPVQAQDRNHLKELLRVASGGVVFSTIQKFQPEDGNVYEQLSTRNNIVVIADEAHRTQYGFSAKTVDEKNSSGEVIGKKVVYGFAKYLRDALPNATYLGFTGTPIEKADANTPAVFGNYVDIYDIAQAVEDGATVRIFYESRLAKVQLSEEGKKLIAELDEELGEMELNETQKAKAKWTKMEALIGSEKRIRNIAKDIVTHFEARQKVFDGKGMVVSMSRRIAAELYAEIIKLRPEWYSDDLTKGVIKVVMTAASSDGPLLAKHHTTKEQRKLLAERMKDDDDPLKLVIVRDMWLTGFDAPGMHTLYIDKPMKGHNLMQAIARVNRVHKDKPGGLVVDYLGIAADLKEALSFYSEAGGKGDPTLAQEQAVTLMLEKLEVVSALFDGFAYESYFAADTSQKLSMILAAEEHILSLDDGKKRYIKEVTELSLAYAIAIPHEQAIDVTDEVGFFQAVKARLVKFDSTEDGSGNEDVETTIRQVIDKALVSDKVIDVFDAAGIKKPDISILSEEFLAELKDYQHKNIALEVLKKILNDELKIRLKKNLVESKKLIEMLEEAIKKYHNKILTAAEVMDALISISKEITASDETAKQMGLSDFEYAFYTAVADNDSAKELMQQDTLRELAVVLTQRVRENASIDWTIKESVKAKLKVIVKRTLRQFGYPPDMQLLATETVLRQAEIIANELSTV
ncbi:type I restriction endonuclease subunit R [Cellvibrio japonicus]|uniref:Type I restriction enzyme endonuclease subunit n=1 Tax=Cellvibrio japonicus (strain Ueda107) TaxID=498211 RepID=B3PH37_CELJU|nr:type I restriction endonuclease subunit R [Cellvibrio japonicus]ACE84830.1 HsdR [Cellvibrio japonicus Ueda107]QEI13837.1 type I restriction endonuclease subunit R [Cellvibrio japonicus]QEI17411.1 type I restriction endonuclease subunit R [Cellvibrio japonicus]QEI20987.1 type I restriction endonuclease subunit R [Cellvibrio japonicus]